ncbi:cell wall anchor protein [Chitinophaga polysaccharea]|uniref:alginate lyase family protein n=1 Tax=Chitinophaga TaxID=79328 RepID=UPI0014555AFC|nr:MULTISPECIES: alginate lyase family protein [Chitinophaga]NLR57464.1 cell wall anchor protein [Chitinophaga polysaccharea]NLU95378.1 cell wall anchor protein [Chitinophaga sp. Ak27]
MKLMRMSTIGSVLLFFIVTSCRKEMADAAGKLALNNHDTVFVHPGLLHKQADFDRMKSKVEAGAEPWVSGWNRLTSNSHSGLGWQPNPADTVYRGSDGVHRENYGQLYNDIAAAYATALRWKVSGDKLYAEKSIQIMNAWSARLKRIAGNNDANLAAGLYGYQFANAAEIMRSYSGWAPADFRRFQQMMRNVFYPMNHSFLTRRERCMSHFYANWDLCVMNSILAIGVLCDDRDLYNEAIGYFKYGAGNGAISHAVYFIHPDGLGQWQESGRDQGHTTLGIGLMGTFCEMAWNQGDDMYGYDNNRFLKGAEYVAAYNLGDSVSFKPYTNCVGVVQNVISSGSRGNTRPVWELVYNHYVNRKGLAAPNCARFAQKVRPEGGGGNYGPNSGGFDQLGYGTLTFSLK